MADRAGNFQKQHKNKIIKRVIIIAAIVIAAMMLLYLFVFRGMMHPIAQSAEAGKNHVVCVGDSITYGAGVIDSQAADAYPSILQEKLNDNWQVLNFGYSGRTLLSTGDLPYIKENLYTESLATRADIYIIMLGTNDSKPHNWNAELYEKELEDLVLSYQTMQTTSNTILMQPPKAHEVNGEIAHNIQDDVIGTEIYEIVARVAEGTNSQLIDLYTLTEEHPEWFIDGIHPNAEGNEAIADEIYQVIMK